MEVINLKQLDVSEFKDKDDPRALEYLAVVTRIFEALHAGTLYCRFVKGDRKGSIAKLSPRGERVFTDIYGRRRDSTPTIEYHQGRYNNSQPYYTVENDRFYVFCTWDGRRNKVQANLPDYDDTEFLLNYEGPTIWEKFDSKSAKEEVLKNPDQRDINDKVLAVSDRVLYINARYGSAMALEYGTIEEFKAVVDSKSTTITTIVKSDGGETSSLKHPNTMICKI